MFRFSRYLVGVPMPQDWFYNSPRNIYRADFYGWTPEFYTYRLTARTHSKSLFCLYMLLAHRGWANEKKGKGADTPLYPHPCQYALLVSFCPEREITSWYDFRNGS